MLEERKLQKAKISLMRNPKFALLQGVMMIGRTSIDETTPTAKTNGRDEVYGRDFVKKLKDTELNFVIAHEASHKMYRHLTTWRKLHDENHKLANMACDYVINLMLTELDPEGSIITMPKLPNGKVIGLLDSRFKGMNTKQVFDILKEEGKDGDGDDEDGGGGDGFDDHDWEKAKDMTDEEKRELEREIDQAIRQGLIAQQKFAGKGSGGLDRELEGLLEPKINWREVLREFVKSMCRAKDTSSWRRVNRRYLATDLYMPSLIGEKVGHLVIAVDTSGSIGGDELSDFLSEVKGIAEEVNPEIVDLIYWDGEVAGHEKYDESSVPNIVSSTKPVGGGGTDPSCVSKYLLDEKIEPECVIVLTDGYVPNWGSGWTSPVMWVVVDNSNAEADVGITLHINSNDR